MLLDLTAAVNVMGLCAVAVFAISGALDAARQRMDILGFMLIGVATGLGGGTLRDLLMGALPVFWVREPVWILTCLVASAITFFIAKRLDSLTRALLWMDAVGLALFAAVGTEIALKYGASSLIAVCMGVMSATFGGICRDVLCGSNLTLMNEEIYITTAVAGSSAYIIFDYFGFQNSYSLIAGFIVAFALRSIAIIYKLKLPNPYRH